jgi:hypothetical protein
MQKGAESVFEEAGGCCALGSGWVVDRRCSRTTGFAGASCALQHAAAAAGKRHLCQGCYTLVLFTGVFFCGCGHRRARCFGHAMPLLMVGSQQWHVLAQGQL